jgi:hypothetical protein
MMSVCVHSTGGHRIHLLWGFVSLILGIVQLSTVAPRLAASAVCQQADYRHDPKSNSYCEWFFLEYFMRA